MWMQEGADHSIKMNVDADIVKKFNIVILKRMTSLLRNHANNCKKKFIIRTLVKYNKASNRKREDVRVGILRTWKYNEKTEKLALSMVIILYELPFKFVEGIGFRLCMSILCPKFVIPSRWTIGSMEGPMLSYPPPPGKLFKLSIL